MMFSYFMFDDVFFCFLLHIISVQELAHNEISEHNDEFKALNSQIKREALEMDWTRSRGHRLGDAYSNRSFITREQAIQRMLAKQEDAKSKQKNKRNGGT